MLPFRDYIWRLLPSPLATRQDGAMGDLVKALHDAFVNLKASTLAVRMLWVSPGADGYALDLIGKGRQLPRLTSESDANYARRLCAAAWLYEQGGTPPAIVLAMLALGLQDIEVVEGPVGPLYDGTWNYDGSKTYSQTLLWAEFYIKATIPDGLQFDAVTWKNFLRSVAKWKAGHTRCAKLSVGWSASDDVLLEDSMALQWKNEWSDGVGCVARYDGTWNYDGSKSYDGDSDSLEVVVQ